MSSFSALRPFGVFVSCCFPTQKGVNHVCACVSWLLKALVLIASSNFLASLHRLSYPLFFLLILEVFFFS